MGCLTLADVCLSKDIHMTYYGTGCIFHYDDKFPMNSGKGFKESDEANFTGSYYSYSKVSISLALCMATIAWSSFCKQQKCDDTLRKYSSSLVQVKA